MQHNIAIIECFYTLSPCDMFTYIDIGKIYRMKLKTHFIGQFSQFHGLPIFPPLRTILNYNTYFTAIFRYRYDAKITQRDLTLYTYIYTFTATYCTNRNWLLHT